MRSCGDSLPRSAGLHGFNSRLDAPSALWTTINPQYTLEKARELYGGAPRPLSGTLAAHISRLLNVHAGSRFPTALQLAAALQLNRCVATVAHVALHIWHCTHGQSGSMCAVITGVSQMHA